MKYCNVIFKDIICTEELIFCPKWSGAQRALLWLQPSPACWRRLQLQTHLASSLTPAPAPDKHVQDSRHLQEALPKASSDTQSKVVKLARFGASRGPQKRNPYKGVGKGINKSLVLWPPLGTPNLPDGIDCKPLQIPTYELILNDANPCRSPAYSDL